MSQFAPGIIRAEFATSVAIDPCFTLDGLLFALLIRDPQARQESRYRRHFWRLAQMHGIEAAKTRFQERGWSIPAYTHALPLAVWGHGVKNDLWVYCASYGVPDSPWEWDTQHWTRRLNAEQVLRWVEQPPKRVETGKGPYRSYCMPLPLLVTKAITWHVRGDLEMIERLLANALYIGKKRSQGYGRVKRWIVEHETVDCSVWDGDKLNRPVPAELLEALDITGEFEYGYYAYRPPYHDARNFTHCAMRGRRTSQTIDKNVQKAIFAA